MAHRLVIILSFFLLVATFIIFAQGIEILRLRHEAKIFMEIADWHKATADNYRMLSQGCIKN